MRTLLRTENYGQSDTIFKPLGNLRASAVILGKEKAKREQEIWTRFVAETLCNKISVQFLFGDGRGDQTDAFNAGEGTYFGRVEEVGEGQEFSDLMNK